MFFIIETSTASNFSATIKPKQLDIFIISSGQRFFKFIYIFMKKDGEILLHLYLLFCCKYEIIKGIIFPFKTSFTFAVSKFVRWSLHIV